MSCKDFKPFEFAIDTCDTCGEPAEVHPARVTEYSEYREAIWKTLFKYGGVPCTYGGYDDCETIDVLAHLGYDVSDRIKGWAPSFLDRIDYGTCKIDWKLTQDPKMDSICEFNGTFATTDLYVTVVLGNLFCECGDISWQQYALRDKTLGQLIWLTVKEGEKK